MIHNLLNNIIINILQFDLTGGEVCLVEKKFLVYFSTGNKGVLLICQDNAPMVALTIIGALASMLGLCQEIP
ncbi:MAG: hypothetical protein A4E46_01757 [Methanosaeta sp. PtaU1.Bin016]|jgi:hypothetical protein|nr:MAG: hypothetical protein A4E46_01757 [Methanosaeta sp. PtaU1.Bin016]